MVDMINDSQQTQENVDAVRTENDGVGSSGVLPKDERRPESTPGDGHHATPPAEDENSPLSPLLPLPPFQLGPQLSEIEAAHPKDDHAKTITRENGNIATPMMKAKHGRGEGAHEDALASAPESLVPDAVSSPVVGEALSHEVEGVNTNVGLGGGQINEQDSEVKNSDILDEASSIVSLPEPMDTLPTPARPYVSPLEADGQCTPPITGRSNGPFVLEGLGLSLPPLTSQPSAPPTLHHVIPDAPQADSPLVTPQLPFIDTTGPSFSLTFSQGNNAVPNDTGGIGGIDFPVRGRRQSAVELSPTSTPVGQLLASHRDLRRLSLFDPAGAPSLGLGELVPPRPSALGATRRTQSAADLHAVLLTDGYTTNNAQVSAAATAIPPHLRPARGRQMTPSALSQSAPRSDSMNTYGTADSSVYDDGYSYSRSSSRSHIAGTDEGDGSAPGGPASAGTGTLGDVPVARPRPPKQESSGAGAGARRYSTFAEMGIANVAVAGKRERTIDARKREQQLAARSARSQQTRTNRLSKAFTRDSFSLTLPGVGSGGNGVSGKGDSDVSASASEVGELSRPGSRPSSSAGAGSSPAGGVASLPPGAAPPVSLSSPAQQQIQTPGISIDRASYGNEDKGPIGNGPGFPNSNQTDSAKRLRKSKSRDCVIM